MAVLTSPVRAAASSEGQAGTTLRVAVADPNPTYCYGLAMAMRAHDIVVDQPECLVRWVQSGEGSAAVVTLRQAGDSGLIVRARAVREDLVILALLTEVSPFSVREALVAGAASAISWDAPVSAISHSLRASVECLSVIPSTIAHSLGALASTELGGRLGSRERQWLSKLALGTAVSELAAELGYSPREMFRLLSVVYKQVGARNRCEAIARAAMLGYLTLPPAQEPDVASPDRLHRPFGR